jgi:hypothetical protein
MAASTAMARASWYSATAMPVVVTSTRKAKATAWLTSP